MPEDKPQIGVKRHRELKRYQALSLSSKVRYARRLITRGLEQATRPAVAWSGGKDSTCLLHLVLEQEPDIDVMYNDTGVEFPETRAFVEEIASAWQINLHVAKPPPGTFWWCVEKYGFPLLGKRTRSWQEIKEIPGIRTSNKCCYYCKEKPSRLTCRELGIDLLFLGIMAAEGMVRKWGWYERGDFYHVAKEGAWKVHPLSIWTDEDVWEYTRQAELPVWPLYSQGHRRNGCWPCCMDMAFDDNHLQALHRTHPKLWRYLIVDRGLGEMLVQIKLGLNQGQLDLFASTLGVEAMAEMRPCFFDKL